MDEINDQQNTENIKVIAADQVDDAGTETKAVVPHISRATALNMGDIGYRGARSAEESESRFWQRHRIDL